MDLFLNKGSVCGRTLMIPVSPRIFLLNLLCPDVSVVNCKPLGLQEASRFLDQYFGDF